MILNNADNIKLGSSGVSFVYLGTNLIWPTGNPLAPVLNFDVTVNQTMFQVDDTDNAKSAVNYSARVIQLDGVADSISCPVYETPIHQVEIVCKVDSGAGNQNLMWQTAELAAQFDTVPDDNQWHKVTLTPASPITLDKFNKIGSFNADHFAGQIDSIKFIDGTAVLGHFVFVENQDPFVDGLGNKVSPSIISGYGEGFLSADKNVARFNGCNVAEYQGSATVVEDGSSLYQLIGTSFNTSRDDAYKIQIAIDTNLADGYATNQFQIHLANSSAIIDCDIDWGDGTVETKTSYPSLGYWDHTYATGGVYTVTITGSIDRLYFENKAFRGKITSVIDGGMSGADDRFQAYSNTFNGCYNMTSYSHPFLYLTGVDDMQGAFRNCPALTSWDAPLPAAVHNLQLGWSNNTAMTTFSADIPETVTTMFAAFFNTGLQNWNGTISPNSKCIDYNNCWSTCALTQASVDAILTQIDAAGTSNGVLIMNGGTSSAPSATGNTAKSNLQSRGWNVQTN